MPHFGINQRSFPRSKVCAFQRNGVRHAPFRCAAYTVLLCGLRRFTHTIEQQVEDSAVSSADHKRLHSNF
jgi:hypothetical protein